jgi:hypothetical protein
LIEDWKPQLAFRKVEIDSENYLNLKQSIMVDNNPDNNFPKLEILLVAEKKDQDVDSEDLEIFKKKIKNIDLTEDEKKKIEEKFGELKSVVVSGNHRVTIFKDLLSSKTREDIGYNNLRYRPSNVFFNLSDLEIEILGTKSNKNV